KRECGRDHPDEWNEEAEPRERQQNHFPPPFAVFHDLDDTTPLAVRCPDGNHDDGGREDYRLRGPRIHGRALIPPTAARPDAQALNIAPVRRTGVGPYGFGMSAQTRDG